MRSLALLLSLAIFLSLAACRSDPTPVGPQDGAVWVDVDVNIPSSNPCAPADCESQPAMPETPCAPCPEPSVTSAGLLGDPMPPVQFAGEFQDAPWTSAALAGPEPLPSGSPVWAYLFFAGLSGFVGYFVVNRKRLRYRHLALILFVLGTFSLQACAVRPALMSDLNDAVDAERQVDEVKADTFEKAIADGEDLQVATGKAFGAYVGVRPEKPAESGIDVLGILGMVLGGGVTGTGLVRLLRGTSLKSGSGNGKT